MANMTIRQENKTKLIYGVVKKYLANEFSL